MRISLFVFGPLLLAATFPVRAETEVWSEMAEIDLAEAYRLVAENHPGAAIDHGDIAFQENLEAGYADAQRFAQEARTYRDYRGVLQRFAASFNDGHLWSDPINRPDEYGFAGFLVERSGGDYVVKSDDSAGVPTAGSRLLSCDGIDADNMEEASLAPFYPSWDLVAVRKQRSVRLLYDRNDYPYQRPSTCDFVGADGSAISHDMQWQDIDVTAFRDIASVLLSDSSSEAGISEDGAGLWIHLPRLDDTAGDVVTQINAKRSDMESVDYVVVDLRGNGGGASFYSDQLAIALYGTRAFDSLPPIDGAEGSGTTVWRASEDNLRTLRDYRVRFGASNVARDVYYSSQIAAMETALADGVQLSTLAPTSGEPEDSDPAVPPLGDEPVIILLTDGACFSSCLLAAQKFRALGAIHVGQETSANTHYSEVRLVNLPSGLSNFTTLQAYIPAMPMQVGPYTPDVSFSDEVMKDFSSLKAAVRAVVK